MPLEKNIQELVLNYCKKDLAGDLQWHIDQFKFIDDLELRNRVGRAFYTARYISKLMEALFVSGDELHPFIKFQIIQFAAIYEAVVVYVLWAKFPEHEEVKKLQTHKAYKPIRAFASKVKMVNEEHEIITCVYKDTKTNRNSIPFKDKVDCAVRIGFIEERFAEDIKQIYAYRNLAHIESEAERKIELEIGDAKKGYWRMRPFLEKINEFLTS
jgi:hypothetical protein